MSETSHSRRLPNWLYVVVAIEFALRLWGAIVRPPWLDELLERSADILPLPTLWHTQLHTPVALEPPFFHLLSHSFLTALGNGWCVGRLPSLLLVAAAQLALFAAIRRVAGTRAGWIAALLPGITAVRHYAGEARPYALLFACAAIALWVWTAAVTEPAGRRKLPLFTLFAALAAAITSHFNGALLLLPFAVAEATRAFRRQPVDRPRLLTLAAAAATVLLDLPYVPAALPWRANYAAHPATLRSAIDTYQRLLYLPAPRLITALAAAGIIALLLWRRAHRPTPSRAPQPPSGWLPLLLTLSLFPLWACVLALLASHVTETRYAIPVVAGIAALAGFALTRTAQTRKATPCVIAFLLIASLWLDARSLLRDRTAARIFAAETAAATPLLAAHPADPIYVWSLERFLLARQTLPPAQAQRFVLLDSRRVEMARFAHDTDWHITTNLALSHPDLPTRDYDRWRTQPGPKLLLVMPPDSSEPQDWVLGQLRSDGLLTTPVARLLGGELYRIAP